MPSQITITPELLLAIVGSVLALLFGYVPKFKDWYSALASPSQALIMLVVLVVVSIAVFIGKCGNFIDVVNIACTTQGAANLLWYLFLAVTANQSTYLIAVRPYNK